MFLGESFDVVEAIRRLAAEVDSVQQVNAALKARVEVLEGKRAPRPLITVGDLVAESEAVVDAVGDAPTTASTATPKATGRVKKA